MGNYIVPSTTEVYLCDPEGIRIELLDYFSELEYIKKVNNPGPFRIRLPSKFDRKKVRLDNIIEIWRGFGPGTLKLDYCGFLLDWDFGDEGGIDYTELTGLSSMELMKRRIVKDYAGSAQAAQTDSADDLIKSIAKDQLGSDTTAARDLTSVGGGFTIQADLADGQSITKDFAYKNMLTICQEIAASSAQAGTKVYFDIVPVVSSAVTGALAFQLQTFTDQRGNDRTQDSSSPIFIGKEWGNFNNGVYSQINSEAINYCYVLGMGEGESRETTEVSKTAGLGLSIWNRREGSKDARNVTEKTGDATARMNARTAEGNTFLDENKPKIKLGGDIVETPSFRYSRDWNFGDMVTISYVDFEADGMIDNVHITRDTSGESIQARIEIEA